jgi:hypothetical protein
MPTANAPNRFVYSPKCYAYVKNIEGDILDLKEYVVGGSVNRVTNAVSSAELRLRNPEMRFTTAPVAFHPMDPITIYLERRAGYPVQVFTGYLDQTPYTQLFPGVVTLKASCTLKKLQYTYFQLSQPYTMSFLKKLGWTIQSPSGGGQIIGPEAEGAAVQNRIEQELKNAGDEGFTKTPNGVPFASSPGAKVGNDGSFSKMLWGLLYFIADWRDEQIYLEAMPSTVPKLINALWTNFEKDGHTVEQQQLESFWEAIVGGSSHGKGGGKGNGSEVGKTGNIADIGKATNTMVANAEKNGVPPAFVIATCLCETGFSQSSINRESGGAIGWFQFQFEGKPTYAPYPGQKAYTQAEAKDTSIASDAFAKAAKTALASNNTLSQEGNWEKWAEAVQHPLAGSYHDRWSTEVARAKSMISQYAGKKAEGEGEPEESQRGHGEEKEKASSGETTRVAAIEKWAQEVTDKHYPYSWGGGHAAAGSPSIGEAGGPAGSAGVNGFDCSGSVAGALAAGGYYPSGAPVGGSGSLGSLLGKKGFAAGPAQGGDPSITVFYNSDHAWMLIKSGGQERYFSTSGSNPGGGAGFRPGNGGEDEGSFSAVHLEHLTETYSGPKPPPLPGSSEGEGEEGAEKPHGAGGGEGSLYSTATAASFISQIAYPSTDERVKAQLFGGEKALMNAQPLLPFVQQVCESTLRSFQSLPNGDFFGFYPDYFGELGHRNPYWKIYDIEILDGGIDLTDEGLATHVFAIGNSTWPGSQELINEVNAGVMTIFEAFEGGLLHNPEAEAIASQQPGQSKVVHTSEAIDFIKRYGARPLKTEFPMVYSTLYESLLAYQSFLVSWSRQFASTFTFTFMPELYPGGKVAFPEHGIQMYIEEVTHTWDLTDGFMTMAKLTAPSVYQETAQSAVEGQLPPNMVDALLEPQRGEVSQPITPTRKALPRQTTKNAKPTGPIFGSLNETTQQNTFGG